MSTTPEAVPSAKKPRISYFFATACGLGYLKPGPGTWGSLAGLGISISLQSCYYRIESSKWDFGWHPGFWTVANSPWAVARAAVLLTAIVGVYVAGKVER